MLQKKSIIRNVWSYFLDSHGLYNNIDNLKDRQNQVNSVRKNAKILLDDLAKLKMDNLLHVLISSKDNYLEFLKKNMENNKRCGFDIEL